MKITAPTRPSKGPGLVTPMIQERAEAKYFSQNFFDIATWKIVKMKWQTALETAPRANNAIPHLSSDLPSLAFGLPLVSLPRAPPSIFLPIAAWAHYRTFLARPAPYHARWPRPAWASGDTKHT